MTEKSPDSIVEEYVESIRRRISDGVQFECLFKTARHICLVYRLEMEVSNGGFEQFFLNPSGDYWQETLDALRAMKATQIELLFKEALTVFPDQKPSKDPEIRANQQLRDAANSTTALFDELTSRYYSIHEECPDQDSYSRMASYILAHPATIDAAWLTWRDRTIPKLAQAAYDERELPSGHLDAKRLAILADALEEAGCTNEDVLAHLRGAGPHVRGCWVVDALLGRE